MRLPSGSCGRSSARSAGEVAAVQIRSPLASSPRPPWSVWSTSYPPLGSFWPFSDVDAHGRAEGLIRRAPGEADEVRVEAIEVVPQHRPSVARRVGGDEGDLQLRPLGGVGERAHGRGDRAHHDWQMSGSGCSRRRPGVGACGLGASIEGWSPVSFSVTSGTCKGTVQLDAAVAVVVVHGDPFMAGSLPPPTRTAPREHEQQAAPRRTPRHVVRPPQGPRSAPPGPAAPVRSSAASSSARTKAEPTITRRRTPRPRRPGRRWRRRAPPRSAGGHRAGARHQRAASGGRRAAPVTPMTAVA